MEGFADKVTFKLSLRRVMAKWQPSGYCQPIDELCLVPSAIMKCIAQESHIDRRLFDSHTVVVKIRNNAKYSPILEQKR